MSSLIDKNDLTRWNRTGLRRFRYIDGNAITYLETLRLAMGEAFTEAGVNQWSALDTDIPEGIDENARERQVRWREQYYDNRRDYAWEILRSYARAIHVLSEHMDAYSNETYLNTATQWDNLRRLVEMLDYHPAPPASAQTPIVLLAKEGKSGTVAAGFAFKNKPEDGSVAVKFETLNDVEVDYDLNKLKATDWDKSQVDFVYADAIFTAIFPLSAPVEGVSVGTLGVLLIEVGSAEVGMAVSVTGVSSDAIDLQGEAKPTAYPLSVKRHQVRLLLKPDFKQSPLLTGSDVVILADDHGLAVGSVVAWGSGTSWAAARVEEVEDSRVRLSDTAPTAGTDIFLTIYSNAQDTTAGGVSVNRVILPTIEHREQWALFDPDLNWINYYHNYNDPESGERLYTYYPGSAFSRAYYVPKDGASPEPVTVVQTSAPQDLTLPGDPNDLATHDWLIAQISGANSAAQIESLVDAEDSYELELSRDLNEIDLLFGDFEIDIRPKDYNINETPVFDTNPLVRSNNYSVIPLAVEGIPELLEIGRTLLVTGKDEAIEVTVKDINPIDNSIKVEPAIPGSELTADGTTESYTRYDTISYGNVVDSGHGETQKQSILGSGDATQSNQVFDFDETETSFITDSNFPPGVRAAIELSVDGRVWQQVATLNDSEPEDTHYIARVKEDGTLLVGFGDGFHGRRLPSGNNNVRIIHRKGAGLNGNVSAFSLEKEVKPHVLVDSLLQPIDATGGNDMETVSAMRDNAPASVLTLERAVSLADFTHLAASNSSVWQARAFRKKSGMGRTERIEVAVVPAGGGSLSTLGDTLGAFLTTNALPGVSISIIPYQSIILELKLTLRIKEDEYDLDLVAEDVKQAVYSMFALKKTKLGAPLYRSQVFAAVESVEGVANCVCEINPYGFRDENGVVVTPRQVAISPDGMIRRVSIAEYQVIYMDEEIAVPEIVTQAFTL